MKIAIILSGQLRTWKLCGELLKKQLLNYYNCDIFMAIDPINRLQHENENNNANTSSNEITEAIDFYKPISVFHNDIIDHTLLSEFPTHLKSYDFDNNYKDNITYELSNNNEFKFDKTHIIPEKYTELIVPVEDNRHLQLSFRQYYYFSKAFEMLYNYSKNNNIYYDIILRVRFDQYLFDRNNNNYDILYSNLEKDANHNILYNINNINIIKKIENDLKLKFEDNIKDNEVYVLGAGIYNNSYIYVNDQFFYFNYNTIEIFNNFLQKLIEGYTESANNYWVIGAHIEHQFGKFLIKNNCNIIKSNMDGIFIRSCI
jgi:hypothetical protein